MDLQLLIDSVPALLHTGRPDGYLDFFNQRWLNFVGLSLKDLSGWKWTTTIHPEDVEAIVEKWRAALATGEPFEHEARVRRADGEYRWMFHRKVPLRDMKGNIIKWYGSSIDIEDRKHAEESQRESDERFRTIFENAGLGTSLVDKQGHPIKCNPAIQKMLGYTEKELRSMAFTDFTHPDDKDLDWQLYSELVAGKRDKYEIEKRYIKKDGQLMWGHLTVSLVRAKDGAPGDYTVGMVKDITERKRAEEALRASEERWRAVFENSAVGIALTDLQMMYLSANHAYQEMVGYTEKELRALSFLDILPEEDRQISRALSGELREGKREQFQLEKRYRRKDGNLIWVRASVSVASGTDGKFRFGMAVVEDITDRKRAEQALREGEERFRALFENVQVGVVVSGPNAEVLSSNPAARELLGVTEEQLLGTTSFDPKWKTFYEDGRPCPPPEHPIPRAIATRQSVQNVVVGVDRPGRGDRVWLLVSAQPRIGPDDKVANVICCFEDITERKRAEEKLRRSEAYLAAGQRLSHTGSWALDVSTGELFWSKETYRIFDFDPAKTTASIKDTFLQRIHPEDRPKVEDGLKAAAIEKGSYAVDYRIVLQDGSIKHIHDVVYPVVNHAGDVVERYGVIMDITERKRRERELQRSRDHLRALAARHQRVREEERTRVAREIHDELGQALTAIKMELSSLIYDMPTEKKEQSDSILKLVDETIQSVRRISTELRPAILDTLGLVAAVEWAAEEFEVRTGTKCQLDLPSDDLVIDQERATALFRIYQETLTNVARHAKASLVHIRLSKEDGELSLEIRDNGDGASDAQLSAGSSLGILGMRERALLLGGELNITGTRGVGTIVTVRMPGTHSEPPKGEK